MHIKNLLYYSPHNSLFLLNGLLLFSSLPSFFATSPFATKFGFSNILIIYFILIFIRESFIVLLGFQLFSLTLKFINSLKINYKLIIFLLPIFSFLYYLSNNPDPMILISGIRFYILVSLPILIYNKKLTNQNKLNTRANDLIIGFYLVINLISFITVYSSSFDSFRGFSTILGPRFSFIFENPIVASMNLATILIYSNFRIFTTNFLKVRLFFMGLSLISLYFCFFTGGRAGLSVGILTVIISIARVFISWLKIFLQNNSNLLKRLLLFTLISGFAFITVAISSLEIISGRYATIDNIKDKGLIVGLYEQRGKILLKSIKEENKVQLFFGRPGYGTNFAKLVSFENPEVTESDSYLTSLIRSYGIFGIVIFLSTFLFFIKSSFSPLVVIIFVIFSLSQSLPELIFPWTQLIIILAFSKDLIFRKKLDKA